MPNQAQTGTFINSAKRFIILPNAMYGNWESAIYGNDFKLIEAARAAKRKS